MVVLICPLTDETRGLVDAAFLARMRDGALLVNAARGPVVVTADLLAALESGRLRAALDVTDPEPLPPDHPLWRAPNTLISRTSAATPRPSCRGPGGSSRSSSPGWRWGRSRSTSCRARLGSVRA